MLHSLSNAVRSAISRVKLPRPAEFTPASITKYSVPFISPLRVNWRALGSLMVVLAAGELPVLYRTTHDEMGVARGSSAGGWGEGEERMV